MNHKYIINDSNPNYETSWIRWKNSFIILLFIDNALCQTSAPMVMYNKVAFVVANSTSILKYMDKEVIWILLSFKKYIHFQNGSITHPLKTMMSWNLLANRLN